MCNVHYASDGGAVVRVAADEAPVAGAASVEPTLEDLYLYTFRDDAGAGAAGAAASEVRRDRKSGLFGGRR